MNPLGLIIFFLICGNSLGDVFPTLTGGVTLGPDGFKNTTEPITQENLPAEDFVEGNWGDIKEGLQISLRSIKESYSTDGLLELIGILRNHNDHPVNVPVSSDFPFRLKLKDSQGRDFKNVGPDIGRFRGMRSWHIPPKMQITMQINLRDYAEIRPGDQLKVQAHIPYLDSIIESGWTEVSVASHENPSNSKKNELNLSRQDSTASPKLDNSQEERRETPFRWLYLLLGGGILIVFLVWWARSRSS